MPIRNLRVPALTAAGAALLLIACGIDPSAVSEDGPSSQMSSATSIRIPTGWDAWEPLGGKGLGTPVIASLGPNLSDAFVIGTDNHLYHQRWDGTRWTPASGWQDMGNMGLPIENVTAVSHGSLVEIFAREIQSQNLVYRSLTAGGTWSAWQNLGGTFIGTPAAVVAASTPGGNATAHVVVRAPDNTIWARAGVAGMFADWYPLNGATLSDPILFGTSAHVELMVRGTDGALYRQWRDAGTSWQPNWQPLGGQLAGSPAVAGSSGNDLFAIASFADKTMQFRRYDGSAWTDWAQIPNARAWSDDAHSEPARPVAFSTGPGSVHVLVQGTDRALWDLASDAGWRGQTIASCFVNDGTPSIAFIDASTVDLVVLAHDQTTWRTRYQTLPSAAGQSPPACPSGAVGQECNYGNTCIGASVLCDTRTFTCEHCGNENERCCGGDAFSTCQNGLTCWSVFPSLTSSATNACIPPFKYRVQVDSVDVQFAAISPEHGGDNYDRSDFIGLGVRVNQDDPQVASCSLGVFGFESQTLGPCVSGFFTEGQLLSRVFTVRDPSDTVTFGIIADNIESNSADAAGQQAGVALQTAGAGLGAAAGIISAIPGPGTAIAAVVGVVAAGLSITGTVIGTPSASDGRSHPNSVHCGGGLVHDKSDGYAADTLYFSLTGAQLRDATASGPGTINIPLNVVAPTGLCRSDQVMHLSITPM